MSHTEQMREAEKQLRNAAEEGPYYTAMVAKDDIRAVLADLDAARAALTAPAAEVPEAMGDDLLFRLADDHSESSAGPVGQASDFWVFEQQSLRDFSKALNDALQSTRLRGGVPEGVGVCPLQGCRARIITAAPQAPALDAGVVRDAERWRLATDDKRIEGPAVCAWRWDGVDEVYQYRRLTRCEAETSIDAAMSAQGGA